VVLFQAPIASSATAQSLEPVAVEVPPELASQQARVSAAAEAAVTLLGDWFGPLPSSALMISGVRWAGVDDAASRPGHITVPLRWLTLARDQSMERALIGGVAAQYWPIASPPSPFEQALITYIATRAAHHQLEGSNFATLRFFGGVVPFALRSVLLSPPVADSRPRVFLFGEDAHASLEVSRGLRAMQTLERYVGWPTLLEALSKMRASGAAVDVNALAQALSEARGTDLKFLIAECFRGDVVFDYAGAALESRSVAGGLVETTVTLVRQAPGLFTTGADDRNAVMPMRVRFADGTEVRDVFDGAAPSLSLVYTAPTAAVSATVDPDVMLLLDVNRQNNTIIRDAGTSRLGVRLALNWMNWLQQTLLSYTAIV